MNGKRTLFLGLGTVLGLASAAALWWRHPGPKAAALAGRQDAMEMLGASIAKLRPGCGVLVLGNPFAKDAGYLNERSQFQRTGLTGLRKGLGRNAPVKVVFPEIHPEYFTHPQSIPIPSDSRTPLSFLVRPDSVDQLARAHPECTVIVSLIGLPVGVEGLKVWTEDDGRSFALLLPDLRMLGPPEKTEEAFRRGKILAAVAEDSRSGEPLIITRDSIAEVLRRQPGALGY